MELLNDDPVWMVGSYTANIVITSGTVELQMQIKDEGFTPMTDDEGNSVFTTSTPFNMSDLGKCKIKAIISDVATVHVSSVRHVSS